LPVGLLGQAYRTRLRDALQSRGDIDAVAHEITVALLDDVANVDADAELDPPFGRQASVALDHPALDFNCAAHRIDGAAELDNRAVAGALDEPAVVGGDGWVDQVASERPKARQRSVLVGPGEPRVADHIGDQDRRQLPGLAHGASRFGPARRSLWAAKAHTRTQSL
jgi:hypothetical protein